MNTNVELVVREKELQQAKEIPEGVELVFLELGDEEYIAWNILSALAQGDEEFHLLAKEIFEIGWKTGKGTYQIVQKMKTFALAAVYYKDQQGKRRFSFGFDGDAPLVETDMCCNQFEIYGYENARKLLGEIDFYHFGMIEFPMAKLFEAIALKGLECAEAQK